MRMQPIDQPRIRRSRPRLSPLSPQGLGTTQVESLSSYICRLAKLHWMHPHAMANCVRRSAAGDTRKTGGGGNLLGRLNGVGNPAYHTAEALKVLGATDLADSLTLLPWRHIMNPMLQGVFRKELFYCPRCVDNDRQAGTEPFIRLLWTLEDYAACVVHRQRLVRGCPTCGESLKVEPWQPDQFFCMACRRTIFDRLLWPLGAESPSVSELRNSHELSMLIQATHVEKMTLRKSATVVFLTHVCNAHCDGLNGAFSRKSGFDRSQTAKWLAGMTRPNLDNLLHIAQRFDESLYDGLVGRNLRFSWDSDEVVVSRNRVCQPRVPEDLRDQVKKRLEQHLRGADCMPTMTSVCMEAGVSIYLIRYHYPGLYSQYMARVARETKMRYAEEKAARVRRVLKAAERMLADGIYPSQRRLRDIDGIIYSDIRRPEVVEALEDLIGRSSVRSRRRRNPSRAKKRDSGKQLHW